MGKRKPDVEIFRQLIDDQKLVAKRTLFVDDKIENIEAAASCGIQTWHLQVGKETVLDIGTKLDFF